MDTDQELFILWAHIPNAPVLLTIEQLDAKLKKAFQGYQHLDLVKRYGFRKGKAIMTHRPVYYDVRRNGETLFSDTDENKALEQLKEINMSAEINGESKAVLVRDYGR